MPPSHVECDESALSISTSFLIPSMGFTAPQHFPDWPGLDSFQRTTYYSSFWSKEGVNVRGKQVAVVGTGPTDIQIA